MGVIQVRHKINAKKFIETKYPKAAICELPANTGIVCFTDNHGGKEYLSLILSECKKYYYSLPVPNGKGKTVYISMLNPGNRTKKKGKTNGSR